MKKLWLFSFLLSCLTCAYIYAADGLKVGDIASDFSLKNVDGSMISLKDYSSSKGIILIFTCNHCPFSKAYEDRIIQINKMYAEKGFPVIAINPNDEISVPEDSYDNMKIRAKEKGFVFPYIHDATQQIAKTYGATRTPHVYLLKNNSGVFSIAYIGAIDDNHSDAENVKEKYLVNAIESLMQNKSANPDFTKAIGCSIKWKK